MEHWGVANGALRFGVKTRLTEVWVYIKISSILMKNLIIVVLILVGILVAWDVASKYIPALAPRNIGPQISEQTLKVTREQSMVVDVVRNVGPSVVTIGVERTNSDRGQDFRMGPFSLFFENPESLPEEDQERLIASGFIVGADGLIVTNKHVVSDNLKYLVVDSKGNKYNVGNIYRDPLNDIAILKVNPPAGGFKAVKLGDSDKLEVGQFAIAIGTALGEFRNTVTTGVISGLGRGITAGNPLEGFVERLDNVIQTDAAINPGNSGGPLLNSAGEVIGVNTAVASAGQNIGFAIPINVVEESMKNFNQSGQFNRAFLGVSYVMIGKRVAILNDLPEGAYVRGITKGSPAEKAGIAEGDIITKIDGAKVIESSGGLASIINKKKVGDTVTLNIYRDGKTFDAKATLAPVQG